MSGRRTFLGFATMRFITPELTYPNCRVKEKQPDIPTDNRAPAEPASAAIEPAQIEIGEIPAVQEANQIGRRNFK